MTETLRPSRLVLDEARDEFARNTASLTLDEALFAAGGYRSVLGVLKHNAGWLHVYRSYALDSEPRHWAQTEWPRGLIDEIDPTAGYLAEILAWTNSGFDAWSAGLDGVGGDHEVPVHWGATMMLSAVARLIARHVVYHTGELNMLLSISRGEAWEYTEEVEENHISSYGHGLPAPWMTAEQQGAYKERLRRAAEARATER